MRAGLILILGWWWAQIGYGGEDSNLTSQRTVPEARADEPTAPTLDPKYPYDAALHVGETLRLYVAPNNNYGIPTYQWLKNGTPIPGATFSQFIIAAVTLADAGNYSVVVSNGIGSVTSREAAVAVSPAVPVTFVSFPASLTVYEGASAVFAPQVAGSGPMTYQWLKDDVALPSASNRQLTIDPVNQGSAGSYALSVTNPAGTVKSSALVLTVLPAVVPVITRFPRSQTIRLGTLLRLEVAVEGSAPFRYRWFKDGVELPQATTAIYQVYRAVEADEGRYEVEVSNVAGTVRSAAVTITVGADSPPTITAQPSGSQVMEEAAFTVSVQYVDYASQSTAIQWTKDGVPIAGATRSTYTIGVVTLADAGAYRVVLTGDGGQVTSDAAILAVTAIVPPSLRGAPSDQVAAIGSVADVYASGLEGTAPFAVRWFKDGQPLVGQGGGMLRFNPVGASDYGTYSFLAANAAGTVFSPSFRLLPEATVEPVVPPATQIPTPGSYFVRLKDALQSGYLALILRADQTAEAMFYDSHRGVLFVGPTRFDRASDGRFSMRFFDHAERVASYLTGAFLDGELQAFVSSPNAKIVVSKSAGESPWLGFYQAPNLDAKGGQAWAAVATDGRLFLTTDEVGWRDWGEGRVAEDGTFTVVLPNRRSHAGHIETDGRWTMQRVASGTVTAASYAGLRMGQVASTRLVNLSTRGQAGSGGDLMIAGFVLAGEADRWVLIRAIGPTLAGFGVVAPLADPQVSLFRGQTVVASNEDWGGTEAAESTAAAVSLGAFALPEGSRDAVLWRRLSPGSYTAQIGTGSGDAAGPALVEVYDGGGVAGSTGAETRISNIATRGRLASADDTFIAGIVVRGNVPKRVLVRAAGPALLPYGVANAASDPMLTVFRDSEVIANNDNWSSSSDNSSQVAGATASAGAFAFTMGSLDAAMVLTLDPGAYTVVVRASSGAVGEVLIETYELP